MTFMRLTDHEAAIWAAVFANRGTSTFVAAEAAARAVQDARRMAKELDKRKDAVTPEAAHMLREMVNRNDANRMDDEELGNALMWLDHRGHNQVADLLRAEYGIFADEDGYTDGSLGPAGLAEQLDIHCPGCGSQAVWLRSMDGRTWCCGNIGHLGYRFQIDGIGATRAKEWYAKWLERKIADSTIPGRTLLPPDAVGGLDDDDDDDPVDDLLEDDLPEEAPLLYGQGFRENAPVGVGHSPSTPDDPLGLAGGPLDPGKFGR